MGVLKKILDNTTTCILLFDYKVQNNSYLFIIVNIKFNIIYYLKGSPKLNGNKGKDWW